MGDVDEGDAGLLLNAAQLLLHILAELKVQGTEGLVQQKHAGLVDQGARDRHALLLTARQGGDMSFLKALEIDHLQHCLYLLADAFLLDARLFQAQTEGDVFINVQMRKQGIALEDRVDLTTVGGQLVDALAVKINVTRVGAFKAADDAKRRCLAATRWTQKSDEFLVVNVKVDAAKHLLAIEGFFDRPQFDQCVIHST